MRLTLGTCLLLAVTGLAQDQAKPEPAPSTAALAADDPDVVALAKAASAFEKAFGDRDATALSGLFTEEGEYIDRDGNVFHGRAAIEAEWAAYFEAQPRQNMTLSVGEWRRLAPQLIVEQGWSTIDSPENPQGSVQRYVAIHLRNDAGQWQLASVRNIPPAPDEVPPGAPLQALAWMVGDWIEESPELVVRMSVRWSDDRRYLLQDFEVQRQGQPAMKGSQRIGWDPARDQIRSWVFDTLGGFAEGTWTPYGVGWMARMSGTRNDGETTSVTYYFEPLGRDAFQILSTFRVVGSEPEPDMQAVVVRVPPPPQRDEPPAADAADQPSAG